ncbi:two-component system activity regulator YycH [Bacillus carboniphilus]|uniref:Two-component system activity regulator YycH n=1 Tax=Bacillus carboniphilus TaxID=86663 RepID=A0ABN0WEP9_9BACI
MKLEKLKSIILTVLVGISLVLTYIQWTYQPGYEAYSEENDLIQSVAISEEKTIGEVVKPTKFLIHRNSGTFGTSNINEIKEVLDNFTKWKFSDMSDITVTISDNEFFPLVHGTDNVEFIFEDSVPLNMYSKVLKFTENHIPSGNFDRIVVDMGKFDGNQVTVYFISYLKNERKIYQARATGTDISKFQTKYYQIPQRFPAYNYYEVEDIRRVYYPSNENDEVRVFTYKFLSDTVDADLFRDALFSNPNFVKKRYVTGGEEYSDIYSLLSVDYSKSSLSFVNPIGASDSYLQVPDALQKSINYINEHAGWTDTFIYDSWSKYENKISFRLFHQGLPVFSEKGQTAIEVIWGSEEIYQYTRPYFDLKNHLRLELETEEVSLPSGDYVLQQLEKQKQIDLKDLQDLTIGYKIEYDYQNPVISLEPTWYYLLAGSWLSITFNEEGGDKHGLE